MDEKTRGKLRDKIWRLEHLYKIKTKEGKIIKFKFNFIQKLILKIILLMPVIKHFTLKARQTGVSTFWLIWWLDEVIFIPNFTVGVLAHKWESLTYLMEILKFIYSSLPNELRPEANISAKRIEIPSINSKIFVSLEVRSTTLNALHVSEWCLCEPEKIRSSMAAIGSNHISGESTANGVGDDGYLTYQGAIKGNNGFKCSFFPWYVQKEYSVDLNGLNRIEIMKSIDKYEQSFINQAKSIWGIDISAEQIMWYRNNKNVYRDLMPQEHPSNDTEAFIMSGDKFFDCRKIMALFNESKEWLIKHPPYAKDVHTDPVEGIEYGWIQFFAPVKGHIYCGGADTADGGKSYNTLKIIDVTDRKEVFVYRVRCGIDKFYRICDEWGRKYYSCILAVERNNHGHAVLLGLREICNYSNIYQHKTETRLKLKAETVPKLTPGWPTDITTRTLMLDQLKLALEGNYDEDVENFAPEIDIFDSWMLQEALTTIEKNGKIVAEEGYPFDLIIATAIAFQMYLKLAKYRKKTHNKFLGITINAKTETQP